jgi:hypothetical protein
MMYRTIRSSARRCLIALVALTATTMTVQAFPGGNPNKKKAAPIFQVRFGKIKLDANLATPMPNQAGVLNQKVKINDEITATLMDYLPRAKEVRTITKVDKGGVPAVTIELSSGKEKLSRDLIADGSDNSKLETIIGPIKVQAFADAKAMDAAFQKLSVDAMRAPTLILKHDDGRKFTVLATKGTKKELKDTGHTIEVLDFRPSFVMSNKSKKVENASKAMTNPAVHYRKFSKDKSQNMWAFAKYPGFSMSKKKDVPFKGTLECPISQEKGKMTCTFVVTPDKMEVWMQAENKVTRTPLTLKKKIALTKVVFAQMTKIEKSAVIKTEIQASPRAVDQAALKVKLDYSGKEKKPSTTHWLRANVPMDIVTKGEVLMLRLGVTKSGGMGGMGGMPKGGMGGMGGGMPKGHPPTGGKGGMGGMPKGHPPTGGKGAMPKGHPPTGGKGAMPKGHPKIEPTPKPKEETKK